MPMNVAASVSCFFLILIFASDIICMHLHGLRRVFYVSCLGLYIAFFFDIDVAL